MSSEGCWAYPMGIEPKGIAERTWSCLPVGLFQLSDVSLKALHICLQAVTASLGLGHSLLCILLPSAALAGSVCQGSQLCFLCPVTSEIS